MYFNSTNVQVADSQKHLGLLLGSKLNFNEYIESKIAKCNKITSLMKKLSQFLSRNSLLTIYKSFVRPNLDLRQTIKQNFQKEDSISPIQRRTYNN